MDDSPAAFQPVIHEDHETHKHRTMPAKTVVVKDEDVKEQTISET